MSNTVKIIVYSMAALVVIFICMTYWPIEASPVYTRWLWYTGGLIAGALLIHE